jgi:hypothetical protein
MDSVSAANASISAHMNAASVKAAHCKKCDSRMVAWVQNKAGKWYLANALIGVPGKVIPLSHRPHFLTCGKTKDLGANI